MWVRVPSIAWSGMIGAIEAEVEVRSHGWGSFILSSVWTAGELLGNRPVHRG